MTDNLGREVEIGDWVACKVPRYSDIVAAFVVGVTQGGNPKALHWKLKRNEHGEVVRVFDKKHNALTNGFIKIEAPTDEVPQ